MVKIERVDSGSKAALNGVKSGDFIETINGNDVKDSLDFNFYTKESFLDFIIKRGEERLNIKIALDSEWDDLGITVEDLKIKHCGNNCVFCFVTQNPKGMRKGVYVRDEDYRFSFLYGNYFTLTNTTDAELERIVTQRFSPLYISVHAVDNEVRKFLLGNMGADNLIPKMTYLAENGIVMHTQVVMCPDYNDGKVLSETIERMYEFYPAVQSVAVVPLGKTKHRKKLVNLRSVTKEDANIVIDQIEKYQEKFLEEIGSRFVFPADEFFLKAGRDVPSDEYYEGYEQYEDGIGMVRSFINEFEDFEKKLPKKLPKKFRLTFLTGKSFSKILSGYVYTRINKVRNLTLNIITAESLHYGEEITVAGLLTGNDIIQAFKKEGKETDLLVLPNTSLGHNNLFLDDLSMADLHRELRTNIIRFENFEQIFDYVEGYKKLKDISYEFESKD
ncbi:MAG: hypothetical protein CR982_00535 [Candidatus Cloacimonadota bacterium]|nr:MAG: hypothetical protein CR982_00535 [Candidatus Cloacimonadota bacterium]PIE78872.1 MAG: hypothetical protein CSA15_05635 [Candidatus Delongbacteria bacterium]